MRSPEERRKLLVFSMLTIIVMALSAATLFYGTFRGGADPSQSLKAIQVTSDSVDAPVGKAWFLISVNVSNFGKVAWVFDPSSSAVASGVSGRFSPSTAYNVTQTMQEQTVGPGKSAVGVLAFLLPSGATPVSISYKDSLGRLGFADVPAATRFASKFPLNVKLSLNGNIVEGWTVSSFNSSERWLGSVIANGVIQNNTLVFFTGQTVQVNLWFEYLKKPSDPVSIRLDSVSTVGGFEILREMQSPSFTMTGWGGQSGVVLLLRVPAAAQSGPIRVSVELSQ